jgi:hypothetical protein
VVGINNNNPYVILPNTYLWLTHVASGLPVVLFGHGAPTPKQTLVHAMEQASSLA